MRWPKEAGIAVNRGIVVDDHLQTGAPDVFAIGECAEHRGICYGLVEPAYEQARVLARHLAGREASYAGSIVATNLKVSGVSVFSAGDFIGGDGSETIVLSDLNHGTYKKLVICRRAIDRGGADRRCRRRALVSRTDPHAAADAKNSRRHDVRPLARDSVRKLHDPVAAMTAIDPDLRAISTTCAYCGVGCGILATPDGRGGAAISGDPEHPANFGRLCSKGSALGETLGLTNRLLYPMIRCGKGTMERVAWSDALDHVAHRFQHIMRARRWCI